MGRGAQQGRGEALGHLESSLRNEPSAGRTLNSVAAESADSAVDRYDASATYALDARMESREQIRRFDQDDTYGFRWRFARTSTARRWKFAN